MPNLIAFIQIRKNKCFKLLPISENIFSDIEIENEVNYSPEQQLEDEEWFKIEKFSNYDFYPKYFNLLQSTTNFLTAKVDDFSKMKFLVYLTEECIYFQKVFKSNFIRTKGFRFWENNYIYLNEADMFVIKDLPDAIYYKKQDKLVFKKLEILEIMFKGISELYREATSQEIQEFLLNEQILLSHFVPEDVKKPNRHRIALVKDKLETFSEEEIIKLFDYTKTYCNSLVQDNKFVVSSDNDLKLLLYGLLERYYTSPVSQEKRTANSIIKIEN